MSNTSQHTTTVALCGNPNCGKTTLFNALTGSNQKVGNWPGVTVEKKSGKCALDPNYEIVDTPGIYSLSPFTADEKVARDFLENERPNLIINVVDCTGLERSLFLTSQLAELGIPMVVALNMQDEAEAKGIKTDIAQLQKAFGCDFVSISAAKKIGIEQLIAHCAKARKPKPLQLHNTTTTATSVTQITARYDFISNLVKNAQHTDTSATNGKQNITARIDKIVLNKWLAFPLFAIIMTAVFFVSVGGVGKFLSDLIADYLTPWLQNGLNNLLSAANCEWLRSLVVDGIVAGVMSVVGFVPQVMLLFGCITLLEASGYMSRIAFITDRLLSKIGLGGRSFVSMILGCGCSVPAIMSTRTIKNTAERDATITLTPFMPCSAKLAIISFFTTKLLGGNALFAVSFYFLSILAVIFVGLILKLFRRNNNEISDTFFMELPNYRMPTVGNVVKQMWERGKAFLIKAGTVILASSIVLWVLQSFNWKFQWVSAEQSMLASIGKLVAPLFYPLGFNDRGYGWQFAISSITGVAAKETVVTTLEILLPQGVAGCISKLGAYTFVAYNLLTVPCVAAISAGFAEQGWKALRSVAFQIVTAYVVCLAIYQLPTLAHRYTSAFVIICVCTAVVAALVIGIRYIVKHRCTGNCTTCNLECRK